MSSLLLVGLNTRHTHSSLSLACLQAFWERIPGRPGIVRVEFDQNQNPEAVLADLILRRPRFIGFAVYIWNIQAILSLSGALKAALPDLKIILGGPEVSFRAGHLLEQHPWLDGIIRGEGERGFEELLMRLLAGQSWSGILGLTHRLSGTIVSEPDRPFITNLDDLPSPFRLGYYGKGKGFTYYEGSRGCPYGCSYCLSSVLGPLRSLSLPRVLSDIDWFLSSGYSQIRFADRTFNQDPPRAKAIITHILSRPESQVMFHCEIKPDLLTPDLIDLLGTAPEGRFHLEIGVQSTHGPTLEAVHRHANTEATGTRVRELRARTKCHIHLDLLAGLPHEGFAEFQKTLEETMSWNPTTVQVGWVKVLRGTGLERAVESGDLACSPLPPYQIVRTRWLVPEEIVAIQDIAKLVEGIHNPGRFSSTLAFLVRKGFDGHPSRFFTALAEFWRRTGRPFFQFSPEGVTQGLQEFLEGLSLPGIGLQRARDLLQHEYRLCQKVPSGKSIPSPFSDQPFSPMEFKLRPGLKVIWYRTDPLEVDSGFQHQPSSGPSSVPVIYSYRTDLSLTPKTQAPALPLVQRLVMSLVDQGVSPLSPEGSILMEPWIPARSFQPEMNSLEREGFLVPVRRGPPPAKGSRSPV